MPTLAEFDARSNGNPFDDVEPHRHLPAEAKAALWAACEMVLACPGDFADAVACLNEHYAEAVICKRLLCDSERMYRFGLWQLRYEGDRCNTIPRRRALRASRPEIPKERRHALLREFWSVPEVNGVSDEFARKLLDDPEKVREWVVQLSVQTARTRGWRIEDGKVVQRSYSEVGERGLPDKNTVEILWSWLDEQCLRTIRRLKDERRDRDAQHRKLAKDRAGRLRQAVADAMETGLPAGRDECLHARRVVLLAYFLTYQHQLKLPGEFGTWKWESKGSMVATLVGDTYVPGRETVLFNPAHLPGEPFNAGSFNIDVERFAALVQRAVNVCRTNKAPSILSASRERKIIIIPKTKASSDPVMSKKYSDNVRWTEQAYKDTIEFQRLLKAKVPAKNEVRRYQTDLVYFLAMLLDQGESNPKLKTEVRAIQDAVAALEGWPRRSSTRNVKKALTELTPGYFVGLKTILKLGENRARQAAGMDEATGTTLPIEAPALSGGKQGDAERKTTTSNANDPPNALPMLTEKAQRVYEILTGLKSHQSLTGPRILDRLAKLNPPIYMDSNVLTSRILPELKPWGLENKPKKGYRIRPPTK